MLTYRPVYIIFSILNFMAKSEQKSQQCLKHEKTTPVFRPRISNLDSSPTCAHGLTFCENIASYPYAHIKYVLDQNPIYKTFLTNVDPEADFTHRMIDEKNFICKSISKVIRPKTGINKNGEWRFIINQDNFVQTVRVEICRSLGAPCDILGEVPEGHLSCKQKYIYSSFLSLNDDGLPATDTFQIPSACCCLFRRNVNFSASDSRN